MGMIICEVHGMTGIEPFIDAQIANNIMLDYQGLPLEEEKNIFLVILQLIFDESEGIESFNLHYYISEKNIHKYKLKHSYSITTDEDEDKFNRMTPEFSGICGKCFEDYIQKYNIEIVREWTIGDM